MNLVSSFVLISCALFANSGHTEPHIASATLPMQVHKKINLNTASVEELTHAIKGIGKKRALAIVQYRQKHGVFKTITDLAAVRGIGLRFVQSHRSALDATFVC